MSEYTLFISDLHLAPDLPEATKAFFQLLKNTTKACSAIYILGDLFESWIGDDDDSDFHREVKTFLKQKTAAGLPIYFLHGNRDFLIGKQFLNETGCQLIDEETVIDLYGLTILLMHGDTLCTQDFKYLQSRKRLRMPFLQKLFLNIPLSLRKYIANKMRKQSERYTQCAPAEIMDVTQDAVQHVMQKHNVNFLIHGHTHQPNVHTFMLNTEVYTRMVLGAWHTKGNGLIWHSNGEKELIEFV